MRFVKISEFEEHTVYEFLLEGKRALVYAPKVAAQGKPWILKTEYFWAFPEFQNEMLKRGWHLAYVENQTRWFCEADNRRRAALCRILQKEFGLNEKCVLEGMSCGGMQAVYFGAKYPKYVKGMYLDAPVMNFLSCPFGVGASPREAVDEFTTSTGLSLTDLINYRNHPIDKVDALIKRKIPVFLVGGDCDTVVPYDQNGAVLAERYKKAGAPITEVIKPGCNHHPHSLSDNTPIIEWAERLY